ncbi:hypothetical protein N9L68_08345 [bacterium]|nr:hypothetical protein [bacterium]
MMMIEADPEEPASSSELFTSSVQGIIVHKSGCALFVDGPYRGKEMRDQADNRGKYYFTLMHQEDTSNELTQAEDQYAKWVEYHYVVYPEIRVLHWAPEGPQDREAKDLDLPPGPGGPSSPEESREYTPGYHHLPEQKAFVATLKRTESDEPQLVVDTKRKVTNYVTLPMYYQ